MAGNADRRLEDAGQGPKTRRRRGPRLPIRLVPPLDTYPSVVAFAQRPPGKLAAVALFSFFFLVLTGDPEMSAATSLAVFAFTFWPRHRENLLTAATLLFVVFGLTDFYWETVVAMLTDAGFPPAFLVPAAGYLAVALVLLFCYSLVFLVRSRPFGEIARPNALVISLYVALLCLASYLPLSPLARAVFWVFLIIFGRYLWFLCFTLKESRYAEYPAFRHELGRYMPFWLPGNLPYPKGYAYLNKITARTEEDLAVVRLKGLKLIFWALLLSVFGMVCEGILYGEGNSFLGAIQLLRDQEFLHVAFWGETPAFAVPLPDFPLVPRFERAFALCKAGTPLPWHANWVALVTYFIYDILFIAITTHIVIAVIRMCGYNALRNVYRPLQARSLADFWNRLYYYFKELLVEIFFYPTFLRYFKDRPALRLFCATFAAAGLGNFLYHFFLDVSSLMEHGFFGSLVRHQSYGFYAFVLSLAIFLSQWRKMKTKGRKAHPLSRYLGPLSVLAFYCLLNIFAYLGNEGLAEHFLFFFSLFNIRLY